VFLGLYYFFGLNLLVLVSGDYRGGELLCGFVPVIVLILQILPSLGLLYYYGLISLLSELGLKVVGHQWY